MACPLTNRCEHQPRIPPTPYVHTMHIHGYQNPVTFVNPIAAHRQSQEQRRKESRNINRQIKNRRAPRETAQDKSLLMVIKPRPSRSGIHNTITYKKNNKTRRAKKAKPKGSLYGVILRSTGCSRELHILSSTFPSRFRHVCTAGRWRASLEPFPFTSSPQTEEVKYLAVPAHSGPSRGTR